MLCVSRYTHFFKSPLYGNLLYNARSNSFAEISEDVFVALSEAKAKPERIQELFDDDDMNTLCETKVLINQGEDDDFVNVQKMQYLFAAYNQTQLSLTVAPTSDCNFRCPYCYEENKPHVYMTSDIEDAVVEFVNANKPAKKVFLTWYGGEPLLNFNGMNSLMDKLKTQVEDKELVHAAIITNGFLLDSSKYSFFEKYPIGKVQFTLDGVKETHNKTRLYKDNKVETYDIIMRNIKDFALHFPDTRVDVRIHVKPENRNEFGEVYNELKELKGDCKNIVPYPGFIVDAQRSCTLMNHREISNFYYNLHKDDVFHTKFYPTLSKGGCCATAVNAYVVGPEGNLYKCWMDVGYQDRVVGNIVDMKVGNKYLLADYLAGATMYDDVECRKCFFLPICDGGCYYQRLRRNKEGITTDLCTPLKDNLSRNLEIHYGLREKK